MQRWNKALWLDVFNQRVFYFTLALSYSKILFMTSTPGPKS